MIKNPIGVHNKLLEEGIPVIGVSSDGRIWTVNGDIQNQQNVRSIVNQVDGEIVIEKPTIEERLTAAELVISMLTEEM